MHADGYGDHSRALRVIGATDLALVPGLVAGRRRWQWMAARAGLNLAIGAYCVRLVRRERAAGAKVGVLAMVIATVDDGRRVAALRRARPPDDPLSLRSYGSPHPVGGVIPES